MRLVLICLLLFMFPIFGFGKNVEVDGVVTIDEKIFNVTLSVPYNRKGELLLSSCVSGGIKIIDPSLKKPLRAKTNVVTRIEFFDKKYGNIILRSITNKGKSQPFFSYYRVLEEGNVILLKSYGQLDREVGNWNEIKTFLYVESRSLIKVTDWNFRKKVRKELKDCPEMEEGLDKRWHSIEEMQKIIKIYNQNCA